MPNGLRRRLIGALLRIAQWLARGARPPDGAPSPGWPDPEQPDNIVELSRWRAPPSEPKRVNLVQRARPPPA